MRPLFLPCAALTLLTAQSLLFPRPSRASHDCTGEFFPDPRYDPPVRMSPEPADHFAPPVNYGQPAAARSFGAAGPAMRQPVGALTGKLVFTNGGHGWTADSRASSGWRLQRGISNNINEDYGNSDQINLFADYCFNAGATVIPLRPIGHQVNEVVLDNDDPSVTWTGSWSDSSETIFYGSAGDVPYRSAALAATETATATYRPLIPKEGLYPVYTWVRPGSNRGDQLYRIRHTGGESEVRIPHHRVGNGWVYLGQYHFNAGASSAAGAVVISNLRSSATGTVVIADAIRFGNGMGSIDQGTGVSGYPREDENSRYWVQASLGQGQSSTLYDGSGNDEQDSWLAPPRMSAEMNREQAGTVNDRVHLSFHTNAGGGRGTVGLITGTPTPNQAAFAQLCGREVTDDLVALGSPPLETAWSNRSNVTFTGGYSEISDSNFNGEMAATILEVAFHDDLSDARLLRDSKARLAVAKAALHAVIRYMNTFAGGPLVFPPDAPENLRAAGGPGGSVTLTWSPPASTGGSGPPTGYTVYRSADGAGFGSPLLLGNVTTATLTGLPAGVPHFFRVSAANAGGESFPSETASCRIAAPGQSKRVLLVNGYTRFDRSSNLLQSLTPKAWSPPGPSGTTERVLPNRSNSFSYLVPHAHAVSAFGFAFDSCSRDAVDAGAVSLTPWPIVVWAAGQQSSADETFTSAGQSRITAFRSAGGHVMVSGSEIAWDLDRDSGPGPADRAFYNLQLKAGLGGNANDNSRSYTIDSVAGSIFAGRGTALFDDGSQGVYRVQTPDVLTPLGPGTRDAMLYQGVSPGAAAIQYDGSAGGGRVVNFGFPFETIVGSTRREQIMADILTFFTTGADYADHDGDSLNALVEHATGTSDFTPDPSPPLLPGLNAFSNPVTLVYRNPLATGVIATLEAATIPAGPWTAVARSTPGNAYTPLQPGWTVTESPSGTRFLVTLTAPESFPDPAAPRAFVRLRITRF